MLQLESKLAADSQMEVVEGPVVVDFGNQR